MSSFLARALTHLPSLMRVARRLTRSEGDADDLVQDTLIRALDKQTDLRDPERLRGWLLATQRTVYLNSRRSLRHRLEVLEGGLAGEHVREPVGDLEQEIAERSLSSELSAALDSLPAELRDALWLREVEDLDYAEIALVQGCPIGTVRSRLARARRQMMDALGSQPKEAG